LPGTIASETELLKDTDGAQDNTKDVIGTKTGLAIVVFNSGPTITNTFKETGFDIYAIAGYDKCNCLSCTNCLTHAYSARFVYHNFISKLWILIPST